MGTRDVFTRRSIGPETRLGAGESLFRELDIRELGYHCSRVVAGERATHCVIIRKD